MNKHPIIKVDNLQVQYDNKIVLKDINFVVYPGEIFMIIGGSGCGKTTLLNHMIGLLEPALGNITIVGKNINDATESQRLSILKEIGVLYQNSALFGSMTILQNVSLPLEELTQLPSSAIVKIARNKLKMVGLNGFENYFPAQVSGGMQKRAAIARAMALDPKILFLDEPSSGLDPISSFGLDKLIVNLAHVLGITFVIVSHDLASICKIAKRVILLNQGTIVGMGRPEDLYRSTNDFVKKFFANKLV